MQLYINVGINKPNIKYIVNNIILIIFILLIIFNFIYIYIYIYIGKSIRMRTVPEYGNSRYLKNHKSYKQIFNG